VLLRFYPTPEGLFVNHHSIEVFGDGPRIWMAPLKWAVVDADGRLRLERWSGIGVYVEQNAEAHRGTGIILETRGCTEIATIDNNASFTLVHRAEIGIEPGKAHPFRLLLRRTMLEFYLDNLLVQCHSLPEKPTGVIGLIFESGQAVFEDLRA